MHMMLFLLLKESIIEMQEGHCSKICISILQNNYVEIINDGRGIPLVDEVQKSSKILNRIFGGHPTKGKFTIFVCIVDSICNLSIRPCGSTFSAGIVDTKVLVIINTQDLGAIK